MKQYTTVSARDFFSDVVSEAAYGDEAVIITRNRYPIVAMISIEEYKAYMLLKGKQKYISNDCKKSAACKNYNNLLRG